jgi:transcriptional regulator with XRE-family HTH domain
MTPARDPARARRSADDELPEIIETEYYVQEVRPGKRRYRRWKREAIKKARAMRAEGAFYSDIEDELGMVKDTVRRYVSDVALPPKRKPRYGSEEGLHLKEQAQERKELRYMNQTHQRIPGANVATVPWEPTIFPSDPDEFNTTGPDPDPDLIAWAMRISETYQDEKVRGAISKQTPVAVTQATLAWMHHYRTWDEAWFLARRDSWQAVREMGGVSRDAFCKRTGISESSLSRYEGNQRTPDLDLIPRLHLAYVWCLEQALVRQETILCLRSCLEEHPDAIDPETRRPLPPGPDGFDDYLWWMAGGRPQAIEDFDIEHIGYLAQVRAMIPRPQWREGSASNLWLAGYAESNFRDNRGATMTTGR